VRLDDASPQPFWLDRPRPAEAPPLEGDVETDLATVGAGFTGLWAAVQAKEERPDREVVLLQAATAGFGGSGRNGGFVDASLTHGLPNGAARFRAELDVLESLGRENLEGLKADLERHRIDATWQDSGMLSVATRPHEVAALEAESALLRRYGWDADVSTATPSARRSRHRPTSGPSSSARAWRWPTPGRSRSACAGRRSRSACGCTSAPRSSARRPPSSGRPSAGRAGKGSPTAATASTTTGSRPTDGSCSAATRRSTGSATASTTPA